MDPGSRGAARGRHGGGGAAARLGPDPRRRGRRGHARDALHLPGDVRIGWERVETADWDEESDTLHVVEVGGLEGPGREHRVVLGPATVLLALVRERVTATVVLQRHVAVRAARACS